MKPVDVCYGMIKAGIALSIAIVILALFGPTVTATGAYLIGPRRISCGDYTIKVPLRWKTILDRCDRTILLERRSDLLFNAEPSGDTMYIDSLRSRSVTLEGEEEEFRQANHGQIASPLSVSDVFSHCLRAEKEPDGAWVSVECIDMPSRTEFTFFGPEKRLHEAVSLIEIKR